LDDSNELLRKYINIIHKNIENAIPIIIDSNTFIEFASKSGYSYEIISLKEPFDIIANQNYRYKSMSFKPGYFVQSEFGKWEEEDNFAYGIGYDNNLLLTQTALNYFEKEFLTLKQYVENN
jgi:hypothetical protein